MPIFVPTQQFHRVQHSVFRGVDVAVGHARQQLNLRGILQFAPFDSQMEHATQDTQASINRAGLERLALGSLYADVGSEVGSMFAGYIREHTLAKRRIALNGADTGPIP